MKNAIKNIKELLTIKMFLAIIENTVTMYDWKTHEYIGRCVVGVKNPFKRLYIRILMKILKTY